MQLKGYKKGHVHYNEELDMTCVIDFYNGHAILWTKVTWGKWDLEHIDGWGPKGCGHFRSACIDEMRDHMKDWIVKNYGPKPPQLSFNLEEAS